MHTIIENIITEVSMHSRPLLLLLLGCSGEKTIQVVNNPPSVAITTPASGMEFPQYSAIEFVAFVDDPQQPAEELSVIWTSDIDGVLNEDPADSAGTATLITSNLSPGSQAISIKVIDDEAMSNTDFVDIYILEVEEAPSLSIRTPQEDETGVENESIVLEVVVEDGQDEFADLFVDIQSDVQQEICADFADETGLFQCETVLNVGLHTLTFTVTDTTGNVASEIVVHEVLALTAIDDDGDGFTEEDGDCDDTDSSVYPDAEEFPNEIDDDCNDIIDDGTTSFDDDGDCFCEEEPCLGTISEDCSTLGIGDCDDASAAYHPGAVETCDTIDNDCDNIIDEDTQCYDDDQDGFSELDGDCDDADFYSYPFATELADGIDNDCDNTIDEGTSAFDDDGDCFCETFFNGLCSGSIDATCSTLDEGDCDDGDDAFSPAAPEYCDGVDNNCDNITDPSSSVDAQTWYTDSDGDGYGDLTSPVLDCYQPTGTVTNSTDCDDSNTQVNPGFAELCDGLDNNCANGIDEGVTTTYYADTDSDSFGDSNATTQACSLPSGYASNDDDCDDGNAAINPNATEVCDGADNDCDQLTDDDDTYVDPASTTTWYADGDLDLYGNPTVFVQSCSTPTGYVGNNLDCNDSTNSANPAATEICDGIDNDCDNTPDEPNASGCSTYYLDSDGDSYGSSTAQCLCSSSGNYDVGNDNDCYDLNGDARPGQTAWYTTNRGDGSFDYNCDGAQSKRYNGSGGCSGFITCSTSIGWAGSNPSCGNTGQWVTSCSWSWSAFTCQENQQTRTQECR